MAQIDWIPVDIGSLPTNQRSLENGVEINVGLSPYDIPEAVRGFNDPDSQHFVIQLKYMNGDETLVPKLHSQHLTLMVGEQSGCIYEIRVDVRGLSAESVRLNLMIPRVGKEIKKIEEDRWFNADKRHYEVVRQAIESVGCS